LQDKYLCIGFAGGSFKSKGVKPAQIISGQMKKFAAGRHD